MLTDNDNVIEFPGKEELTYPTFFVANFVVKAEAVLTGHMPVEEARDKFEEELIAVYGLDGCSVIEFREANDDERKDYEAQYKAFVESGAIKETPKPVDPSKLN